MLSATIRTAFQLFLPMIRYLKLSFPRPLAFRWHQAAALSSIRTTAKSLRSARVRCWFLVCGFCVLDANSSFRMGPNVGPLWVQLGRPKSMQ